MIRMRMGADSIRIYLGMGSKRFLPHGGACKTPAGGGGHQGPHLREATYYSRLLCLSSRGLCSTTLLGIDDEASDWPDDFFSQLPPWLPPGTTRWPVSSSHKVGSRHRQGRRTLMMLFPIRLA
ncbi:hypothetical protein CTA1_13190 [Colletotrichum tanaceti]|uniref:Uncharacterized protein n=1 Tax=Colletotrichum tanaceti TaxID=1306861 RepID=A0A4U6X9X8_9PEZI|nr:hypothetical protein CTA1_13190 [Colletotrichum tanaceti]